MTDETQIAELLLRWEEAWEHGQEITPEDLCDGRADLVGALRERIAAIKDMAWVKEDAGSPIPDDDVIGQEAPLPPKTLAGRYRIELLIAEGGFGQVFRGFDPELQRPVAIKIPRPRKYSGAEHLDALLDEARKAASLRHPGIIAVHDAGRDDGVLFIVSDLIEESNLADALAKAPISPMETARLIAEVAEALHYAHEQGFVHRDIKPANILLDSQGKPLLTDFGIAATKDELDRGEAAASGTLAYMAPEQVAGETQLVNARTDVYALGVVLYEMLAGRSPYQARTPTALREHILFKPPTPFRGVAANIPVDLESICLRCLAKHPADRYATAKELAHALRAALASRRTSGQSRRLLPILIITIITILLMLLLCWHFLVQDRPTTKSEKDGALVFDGRSRIITPVEQFTPVTLEAWVRPAKYEDRCHFVIGSDVPTKYGVGLGICGVLLSAEYVEGMIKSERTVPLAEWSHLAAVFGESETRLYLNGKQVAVGPATRSLGGTPFVIGNVGKDNPIDYFIGQIRAVRITKDERYAEDFTPQEVFRKEDETSIFQTVLIYDGISLEGERVIDMSGNGHDGTWERLPSP
jgi:serine/threonine protein kinase